MYCHDACSAVGMYCLLPSCSMYCPTPDDDGPVAVAAFVLPRTCFVLPITCFVLPTPGGRWPRCRRCLCTTQRSNRGAPAAGGLRRTADRPRGVRRWGWYILLHNSLVRYSLVRYDVWWYSVWRYSAWRYRVWQYSVAKYGILQYSAPAACSTVRLPLAVQCACCLQA